MPLTISTANLQDAATEKAIRELIEASFVPFVPIPAGRLAANTESHASAPSFFLVARDGERILGCNGFIANDFMLDEKKITGYQSCWTATHPDYRGQSIFPSLINEAKEILSSQGAGFIYGVPNNLSRPVMINKLGFREIPVVEINLFNVPLLRSRYLAGMMQPTISVCRINERQVFEHKKLQFPDKIKSVQHNNSWLWGKLERRIKLGIPVKVFYVGGMEIENQSDLPILLKKMVQETGARLVRLQSNASNSQNGLFKRWKPSRFMNPFVFYNLEAPAFTHFNVMGGALDVF